MAEYTFFKAEERQYSLGENTDLVRARMMARELAERVKSILKIDEAIALGLYNKQLDCSPSITDDERLLTYALFRGDLTLRTELLYLDRNNHLMAARQTVDDHDGYLKRPTSMFDLATFTLTKPSQRFGPQVELLFKIHSLHQIGIDPKFLYDFGDKYGRKL
ncbi:MAG: hypothetical protein Q7S55_02935 [Nanoarchaeota archaeon]|nr:hypothetical protein [Nanoarchaeota archaeon]